MFCHPIQFGVENNAIIWYNKNMEKRKSILVDVDEVICHAGLLKLMNKFLNTNYKLEEFTNYYIDDDVFKDEKTKKAFFDYYVTQDGYEDAELLPYAKEALEKLNEKYDIYICSAFVMDGYEHLSGKFIMDKYNFLVKNFPFLDAKKFIFTGAKNLFEADVQLDDRLSNMKGNVKQKFMFLSYHNRNIPKEELEKYNVVPVNGWKEVLEILGE